MIVSSVENMMLDMEYQTRMMRIFKRRLRETSRFDKFYLVVGKRYKDRTVYYSCERIDGKEIRKSLARNPTVRRILQERHYLKKAIEACESNISYLEDAIQNYRPLDPDEIVKDSGKAYKEQENARRLLYGHSKASDWKKEMEKEKIKYPPYRPKDLKHNTVDKTLTRSKSEALIYNLLKTKALEFIYELPTKIGDKLVLPDFTIYDPKTGRTVLLEHLGLTSDEDYRNDQYEKLDSYMAAGYVIGRDLLLTCDDVGGKIDVFTINKIIDSAFNL